MLVTSISVFSKNALYTNEINRNHHLINIRFKVYKWLKHGQVYRTFCRLGKCVNVKIPPLYQQTDQPFHSNPINNTHYNDTNYQRPQFCGLLDTKQYLQLGCLSLFDFSSLDLLSTLNSHLDILLT